MTKYAALIMIVGHGTKPGELQLTTISSSNTELDDHKIVCKCLFSAYVKLAAYTWLCLYERMHLTASSKPRKKVCTYKKGAFNNPSLR